MICYLAFLLMFCICFGILQMELDDEVAAAIGLSYEQHVFLQVFRTAIGELAMPGYTKITTELKDDPDNFFAKLNISLLWVTWYCQTFFMIVIMLNFLIAVITSTYERVINLQNQIRYKHKADLNEEFFILMHYLSKLSSFAKLDEFKVIIFSNDKEDGLQGEDQAIDMLESIKKTVNKQNKDINSKMQKINEGIEGQDICLETMENRLIKRIDQNEQVVKDTKVEVLKELRRLLKN
jgi:hypothetical protein